jgi:hypothetical protein
MHRIITFINSAGWKRLVLCSVVACGTALADSACCDSESTAFSGKAVETIDAASYTYVLVDTGANKLWAAAPKLAVKPGDRVEVANAMRMPNYESKTLKRKFDLVYFTGSISVNGNSPKPAAASARSGELPPGHPRVDAPAGAASASDFSNIKKPAGGKSVSEIVEGRKQLKGKEVTVRGKVVKYNSGVMGKNWLHIRDGSGTAAHNDLTVTTDTPARVGATVLVKGKVSTDRNFGSGYFYPVLIEDAHVTAE